MQNKLKSVIFMPASLKSSPRNFLNNFFPVSMTCDIQPWELIEQQWLSSSGTYLNMITKWLPDNSPRLRGLWTYLQTDIHNCVWMYSKANNTFLNIYDTWQNAPKCTWNTIKSMIAASTSTTCICLSSSTLKRQTDERHCQKG